MEHSEHKNNGLITKIWGGPTWIANHAITFGYPPEPTKEEKDQYRQYFFSLGDVLPCKHCRDSYKKFLTSGETALTDKVLQNRETLTKWFYDVHNAVNAKLDVDYGVAYEDVVDKYESFRARCGNSVATGCVTPLNYKAFSFKKLYHVEAPVIPFDLVEKFIPIAKKRGLIPEYFDYYNLAKYLDGDINQLKKLSWYMRNEFCQNHIRYMRENAIPSIEFDNEWTGTPTIQELQLIMFLCSNLSKTELLKTLECLKPSLV